MAALSRQVWLRPQPQFLVVALLVATIVEALPSLGQQWWQRRNTSCLQAYAGGCSAIKDEHTCLSSRDGSSKAELQGLKVQGEPCAWCGGGACHSDGDSLCEPLDYLVRGEGVAFSEFKAKKTYRAASCGVPLPTYYDYSCLKAESSGCGALRDAYSCLSAKDGRDSVSENGLLVHGQPCVWCGGLPCHADNSSALCEPFDFASSADAKDGFPARRTLRLATCRNGLPASAMLEGIAISTPGYLAPPVGKGMLVQAWVPDKPSEDQMKCLHYSAGGCSARQDVDSCLSSRDGSAEVQRNGLKIRGEPCVWCGGGACTSGNLTSKCEPFEYVMMGEGTAFTTFFGRHSFSVASCKGSIRKPPFDYSCLQQAPSSCSDLTEASDCLSSTDGSSTVYKDGLLVAGQPCVWCGGHTCHSGNFTTCGAFDWLVNGEGRSFDQFYAKLTFTMAACTDGKPFPHTYYGPTNETPGVPNWHWIPPKQVAAWGQCGGVGWEGSTICTGGYVCKVVNSTFSHCIDARTPAPAPVPAPTPAPAAVPTSPPAVEPTLAAATASPPPTGRVGEDCWDACGRHGGHCPWCGEGMACCRRSWPSNPPACWDAEGYTAPWRHECIRPAKEVREQRDIARAAQNGTDDSMLGASAPDGTSPAAAAAGAAQATAAGAAATPGVAPVPGATPAVPGAVPAPGATPAVPGAVPAPGATLAEAGAALAPGATPTGPGPSPSPGATAAPAPGLEPTGPGAPGLVPRGRGAEAPGGHFDDQRGGPAAENFTNETAFGAAVEGEKDEQEYFSWVLIGILMFLVCCLVPFLSYYMYTHGCPQKKALHARKKRHVGIADIEDSMAGRNKPLVSNDTDSERDHEEPSLFDLLDADHDGIVTQEEFNRAMGIMPGATQAVPVQSVVSMVPGPMVAFGGQLGQQLPPGQHRDAHRTLIGSSPGERAMLPRGLPPPAGLRAEPLSAQAAQMAQPRDAYYDLYEVAR